LLSLDDWGPDRFTASQRRDLMEIIEDHYGAGSTLITSQLPVEWCLTCTGLGVLP
jgi:DNA replication protein DnaC